MSFSTRFVYIGIGGTGLKIGKAFERLLREEVCGPDGRKLVSRGGTFTGIKPYELPGFIQTLYLDFSEQDLGLAPVRPPAALAGGRPQDGDVREGARQRRPLVGRRHQPAARLEDRQGRHRAPGCRPSSASGATSPRSRPCPPAPASTRPSGEPRCSRSWSATAPRRCCATSGGRSSASSAPSASSRSTRARPRPRATSCSWSAARSRAAPAAACSSTSCA